MSELKLTEKVETMIKAEATEHFYADDLRQDAYIHGAEQTLTNPAILKEQGLYTKDEVVEMLSDMMETLGHSFSGKKDYLNDYVMTFKLSPPKTEQ